MREINKMELKFLSLSSNEAFARSTVAAFCIGLNPSIDELTDIKTAVSEAVTNCVVHAYPDKPGMIAMQVVLYEDYIDISISDEGVGIEDLEKAREPFWTSQPGGDRSGMGFTVMESFMSNIEVSKNKNKGITINMQKYLTKESVAEG